MALIKIENATVTRHIGANGGFSIEEPANEAEGRRYPQVYTIWAKQAPEVGAIVTVTGIYSHAKREYGEGKIAVNVNVNEPQVTIIRDSNSSGFDTAPF